MHLGVSCNCITNYLHLIKHPLHFVFHIVVFVFLESPRAIEFQRIIRTVAEWTLYYKRGACEIKMYGRAAAHGAIGNKRRLISASLLPFFVVVAFLFFFLLLLSSPGPPRLYMYSSGVYPSRPELAPRRVKLRPRRGRHHLSIIASLPPLPLSLSVMQRDFF